MKYIIQVQARRYSKWSDKAKADSNADARNKAADIASYYKKTGLPVKLRIVQLVSEAEVVEKKEYYITENVLPKD